MSKVSLDPYRTPGVGFFLGEDRGRVVATAILEEYGSDITIVIPEDVRCVNYSFWRGFTHILPNAPIVGTEVQLSGLKSVSPTL